MSTFPVFKRRSSASHPPSRRLSKSLLTMLCLSLCLMAPVREAQGQTGPKFSQSASQAASNASVVSIARGGSKWVSAADKILIVGARASADGTRWILTGLTNGNEQSIELSVQRTAKASFAVGTSVGVVPVSAGLLLIVGSGTVAFVPNVLAATLFHSKTLGSGRR